MTIFEKKVVICDFDDEKEREEKREKIRKQKKDKRSALILFLILLTASLVNTSVSYKKDEQKKSSDDRAKLETRKANLFKQQVDLAFSRVAEASGGVALEDYVYLVDDDKPKLFRAKYDPKEEKYDQYNSDEIPLYYEDPTIQKTADSIPEQPDNKDIKNFYSRKTDSRDDKSGQSDKNPKPDKAGTPVLKKKDVNDLEAAAFYKGKIYLVTSHSDSLNKENEDEGNTTRQRFLEVDLKDDVEKNSGKPIKVAVVTRWANLRKPLENALFKEEPVKARRFWDKQEANYEPKKDTVMQIEGLAISPEGEVYLGFRGPTSIEGDKALIARTTLTEIFAAEDGSPDKWKPKWRTAAETSPAKFTIIPVYLGTVAGKQHGIVDMIYSGNEILILTNSVEKFPASTTPPQIWQWNPNAGENPKLVSKEGFYEAPESILSKPEVLLLPQNPENKVVLFLDGKNFGGGQRIKNREEVFQ